MLDRSATHGRTALPRSRIQAANVKTVPNRSPLRYAGGKTWLIPHVRRWLERPGPRVLVEPFAGGATVSLTAVAEGLVDRAVMVELDRDVCAFWRATLHHTDELVSGILTINAERESANRAADPDNLGTVERAIRTLVLNRTRHNGVLARRASRTRRGESDRGPASRWYPSTLAERIRAIGRYADRLTVYEGDGVEVVEEAARSCKARIFIDPPYTAPGGKRAGARLYQHTDVDHERIFRTLSRTDVDFLMTYDDAPETLELIETYAFAGVTVETKTAHHRRSREVLVTRQPIFG